jgi:hypothetical protein
MRCVLFRKNFRNKDIWHMWRTLGVGGVKAVGKLQEAMGD